MPRSQISKTNLMFAMTKAANAPPPPPRSTAPRAAFRFKGIWRPAASWTLLRSVWSRNGVRETFPSLWQRQLKFKKLKMAFFWFSYGTPFYLLCCKCGKRECVDRSIFSCIPPTLVNINSVILKTGNKCVAH